MAEHAGMLLWIWLLGVPLIGAIIELARTPKPSTSTYGRTTVAGTPTRPLP